MTIRYDPVGKMVQSSDGRYVAFAEYEELVKEIVEAATDYFHLIEQGEGSASEAEVALCVLVKMLMS